MAADSYIDPLELRAANDRHDITAPVTAGIRSSWNAERMLRRGLLTDRKIEQYRKRGFYDPEYRKARKEFAEKKRRKRSGNFVESDGRMIYSPA